MKRVRLVVIVSVAAVVVTAAASFVARRRALRTPDLARGVEPTVAVARNGAAVPAWMHVAGDEGARETDDDDEAAADGIVVRVGSAMTLVRSPDGRLAADPGLVALPNGSVLLTWLAFRENLAEHGEPYDVRVLSARIDPATGATGAPQTVTGDTPGREYDRPWPTVTTSGRVVVAYRFAQTGDAGITVATSRDGAAWDRRDVVTAFGFKGGLVTACAATGAANVYIAYFDPVRGLVLRASRDDGEQFPTDAETVVSAPNENVATEAPSCFAAGEDVVVAYGVAAGASDSGASAALAQVNVVRSHDAGRTFADHAVVAVPDHRILHPRVVADGPGFALGAYVLAAGGADVRALRGSFDGAPLRSTTVAERVRIDLRRSQRAWPGDYLGFALADGKRAEIAYVDGASGVARVVVTGRDLAP